MTIRVTCTHEDNHGRIFRRTRFDLEIDPCHCNVFLFGFKGIAAHAARVAFAAFLVNGLVPLITTSILELAIVRWSLIVNFRCFQPVTADS